MTERKTVSLFILVACFTLVTFLVASGFATPVESLIYATLQEANTPIITIFAKGITLLSEPVTVMVLCLILIAIPCTRRKIAILVSSCAAFTAGENWILKQIFVRERPNILRLVTETGYSFPSGHSATSAALGTVFVMLLYHYQIPKPKKYILTVLCFIIPFLIGLSRVYLGVHYTGDVVAGWLLGIIIGTKSYVMWNRYNQNAGKKK